MISNLVNLNLGFEQLGPYKAQINVQAFCFLLNVNLNDLYLDPGEGRFNDFALYHFVIYIVEVLASKLFI